MKVRPKVEAWIDRGPHVAGESEHVEANLRSNHDRTGGRREHECDAEPGPEAIVAIVGRVVLAAAPRVDVDEVEAREQGRALAEPLVAAATQREGPGVALDRKSVV